MKFAAVRLAIIERMLSPMWNGRALTCGLILLACGSLSAAQLPEGPGKAVVLRICSGCHPAEIVLTHRDTKEGWEIIVRNMVDKGANGTDDEFNEVIDYLAAHFPKTDAKPKDK